MYLYRVYSNTIKIIKLLLYLYRAYMNKTRDTGSFYFVIFLEGGEIGCDLENCLKAVCTNREALAKITGIRRSRLNYVFTRKGKSYIIEKGILIVKSGNLYKGNQRFCVKGSNYEDT